MAICAFCRQTLVEKTVDHVPPRRLFGDNPKGNLITVPACEECNHSTSNDDEYFRLLALEIGASEVSAAQQANDRNLRAILHPKKKGFRDSIFRSLSPVTGIPYQGGFIDKTFTMELKTDRLLRTVTKTIRGMFHHLQGYPVPEDHRVDCHLQEVMTEDQLRLFQEVVFPNLHDEPSHEVGDKVFRYRFAHEPEEPNTYIFHFVIYERFNFFGFVHPISLGETEVGGASTSD